ncbi:FAD-dependent pyridine nucleotide-disulfide oxidoreductase [Nitzschia inconspicua]|uniref:FAD-dependent pyridine nucleotide-disulfide oxidoreductase n=1 Tax=Nitzschia inconspicua TaxID=303405 RepID=A0A9K3M5T5_9STRA|nr:FAD-dependent pyridine nucleotide-disulfide oxidoreductase [Nitzschia inconspicua]
MPSILSLFIILVLGIEVSVVDGFLVGTKFVSKYPPTTKLTATSEGDTRKAGHSPKHVVIVGGGIGGLSTAFDARHILHKDDKITVVSDRPHFEFTPSNPWVAIHKRTPQEIRLNLEAILPHHNIDFVHAKATRLDTEENLLTVESDTGDGNRKLQYDYLVIATGPRLAFEEIPGLNELRLENHDLLHDENIVASICETDHAMHAAQAIDRLIQNPGPIVVGAVQGASSFGPLYEYALLLKYYLHKKGSAALKEQCPISVVTSEPYIGHLGLQGAGQSKEILTKLLEKNNIDWYTNCKVSEVNKDGVKIEFHEEEQMETSDSPNMMTGIKTKFLPSKLTMLIPPFRGVKLWQQTPGLTDDKGMILVDQHQQSISYPNIFGVGVCVHLDPVEKTLIPTGPPKTGYMIEFMGTACVRNIRALMDESDSLQAERSATAEHTRPSFHVPILNGLCITDFGDEGAIFLTLPQMPPRRTDLTIEGKIGTMAKMAFEKYFLFKIQTGDTDPYYEKYLLHLIGVDRVEREKI